ncbi:hypothetical protein RHS02_06226, partial [Rhizoctonia solani]
TICQLLETKDNKLVVTLPEKPFLSKPNMGATLLTNEPWTAKGLSTLFASAVEASGLENVLLQSFCCGLAKDSDAVANMDLTGIQSGEATEHYHPGAETALQMHVQVGTAVTALANLVAQVKHHSGPDSDNEEEAQGMDQQLKDAKSQDKAFIQDIQDKYCASNEILIQAKDNLDNTWNEYYNLLVCGSLLYKVAKEYRNTNIGILNNIKSHKLYKAVLKETGFQNHVEPVEKKLWDVSKIFNHITQQSQRKGKKEGKKALKEAKSKTELVQVGNKDIVLDYLNKPSLLIADASKVASSLVPLNASALGRNPGNEIKSCTACLGLPQSETALVNLENQIAELSHDQDDDQDEVTMSYREMQQSKQVNLCGRDLNQEVVSITKGSPEEQDTSEPIQEWRDQTDSEQLTMASAYDVCCYLMMLALDPILLDREIKDQIIKDSSKIYCQKCQQYHDSNKTVHSYASIQSLKTHVFNTIAEVYDHCTSDKCVDFEACVAMKTEHELVQQKCYEMHIKHQQEGGNVQSCNSYNIKQYGYLKEITEEEVLNMADFYQVQT